MGLPSFLQLTYMGGLPLKAQYSASCRPSLKVVSSSSLLKLTGSTVKKEAMLLVAASREMTLMVNVG